MQFLSRHLLQLLIQSRSASLLLCVYYITLFYSTLCITGAESTDRFVVRTYEEDLRPDTKSQEKQISPKYGLQKRSVQADTSLDKILDNLQDIYNKRHHPAASSPHRDPFQLPVLGPPPGPVSKNNKSKPESIEEYLPPGSKKLHRQYIKPASGHHRKPAPRHHHKPAPRHHRKLVPKHHRKQAPRHHHKSVPRQHRKPAPKGVLYDELLKDGKQFQDENREPVPEKQTPGPVSKLKKYSHISLDIAPTPVTLKPVLHNYTTTYNKALFELNLVYKNALAHRPKKKHKRKRIKGKKTTRLGDDMLEKLISQVKIDQSEEKRKNRKHTGVKKFHIRIVYKHRKKSPPKMSNIYALSEEN